MKTTILGGIIFLVPLAFLAIILQKVFELSMVVAAPLNRFIPVEHFAGIAFANLLAILLILFVCFLAGLVARRGMFSRRLKQLDNALFDAVPGYAVVKGMASGIGGDESGNSLFQPVLVRFDDFEQIAFEVEQSDDKSTIFLPGSPSAASGSTVIVESDRITPLNLPPHKAVSLLRAMGRGSLSVTQRQPESSEK